MIRMILRALRSIFVITLLLGVSCSREPTLANLEKAPPPELKEPKISIHTFDNGLTLYFLENHELPTFEMAALIEVGSIHEPKAKLGVSDLMMEGLRTAGSLKRSGDEIDSALEQVAAELSSDSDREYSTFKIKSLTKDADLAADIFFELLISPAFEQSKLEITVQNMQEQVRRRNEKPMSVANREFLQQLYGPESVWARQYKGQTVKSLTRDDVIDFYKQFVASNKIRLAVSGDISFEAVIDKVGKRIAGWPPGGGSKRDISASGVPAVSKVWDPSVNLISVPVNQSAIVMGHFGDKRFNPDKYALIVANFILGGETFGSRLGDRIRTALGLAYSVYSDFGFSTDYGSFRMMVGTKSISTVNVVEEAKKILSEMVQGSDISQEEVDHAKKVILNQLIFELEDPFEIVSTRVRHDFFGYPPDYLTIYQKEIREVTIDQVRERLKKYFFPDRLKIMIVGDPKGMGDLTKLGAVKELPLDYD